jgi:hypothetical protein
MKRLSFGLTFLLTATLLLAGCTGTLQTFKTIAETTVPAVVVVPAANTFDILKIGAANYGTYCIQQKMVPAMCSRTTRRVVIKGIRSGTGARDQLEDSVTNGTPAASSIYNVLVAAITSLQTTPAANAQFTEIAK